MERSLPVKKIVESPQVYAAVLTYAHWERYYLTTGYRLFSQHPVEDRRTIWALR